MTRDIPKTMDDMIQALPQQILDAHGLFSDVHVPYTHLRSVYIAGMGGSGIGGDFASMMARTHAAIPVVVGKSYDLPTWVQKDTLVIISSYSGGTEETLQVMHEAHDRGAKIFVISSGGQAIALAKAHDLPHLELPAGWSSPRACLGFSLMAQLHVLSSIGALSSDIADQAVSAAKSIAEQSEDIRSLARQHAQTIGERIPVIYTDDPLSPVALRWRQQIQENAKQLVWHHVLPEMNHNELVGWASDYPDVAVIFLRHQAESPRVRRRLDITTELVQPHAGILLSCEAPGEHFIADLLYLVHLGDWLSYELALIHEVDPIEIRAIDHLKSELAKT